jgi:hypothetical protein
MNKTLKAADEVRKLTRMFQALGEVVEVLDRVGSLEQAEIEASARIDRLNVSAAELMQRSNADRATAEAQLAEIKQAGSDAAAHAQQVLDAAREDAAAIVAKAQSDAKAMIGAAGEVVADADAARAEAEARVREADAKLDDIEARYAKAQAQVNKLLGKE